MVPSVVADVRLEKKRRVRTIILHEQIPINDDVEFSCKTLPVQGLNSICLKMQVLEERTHVGGSEPGGFVEKLRHLEIC
jgi:hypothetical protein